MAAELVTETKEDYLRAICRLEEKTMAKVGTVQLAEHLMLAKSTVSERLKEMKDQGLIRHDRYAAIELTPRGQKVAKRIEYNHRLIEVFLHDTLRLSKEKIHDEAHKLEHAFSDESIEKLRRFLRYPKYCPHGQPLKKP